MGQIPKLSSKLKRTLIVLYQLLYWINSNWSGSRISIGPRLNSLNLQTYEQLETCTFLISFENFIIFTQTKQLSFNETLCCINVTAWAGCLKFMWIAARCRGCDPKRTSELRFASNNGVKLFLYFQNGILNFGSQCTLIHGYIKTPNMNIY